MPLSLEKLKRLRAAVKKRKEEKAENTEDFFEKRTRLIKKAKKLNSYT